MEIIKQGLAFTKAEANALAAFAGTKTGGDVFRFVWFRSNGRELRITSTDGGRALGSRTSGSPGRLSRTRTW